MQTEPAPDPELAYKRYILRMGTFDHTSWLATYVDTSNSVWELRNRITQSIRMDLRQDIAYSDADWYEIIDLALREVVEEGQPLKLYSQTACDHPKERGRVVRTAEGEAWYLCNRCSFLVYRFDRDEVVRSNT